MKFIDHDSDEVRAFVARTVSAIPGSTVDSPMARAVALYYAVRDKIRYEVYGADLSREGLRASAVLRGGSGMCIHKSIVYAAALRSIGVPARLVLTDVRNHLASPRLRELVGGDVFRFHCLTSVYNGQKWVRATPVFNKMLCRLYGITPLDFDGTASSLYHPFDSRGREHMEFLHEHGEFDDLPYDLVLDGLRTAHPRLFTAGDRFAAGSLLADAQPGDMR